MHRVLQATFSNDLPSNMVTFILLLLLFIDFSSSRSCNCSFMVLFAYLTYFGLFKTSEFLSHIELIWLTLIRKAQFFLKKKYFAFVVRTSLSCLASYPSKPWTTFNFPWLVILDASIAVYTEKLLLLTWVHVAFVGHHRDCQIMISSQLLGRYKNIISYSLPSLMAKTEKYANWTNYLVILAAIKHNSQSYNSYLTLIVVNSNSS